MKLMTWVIFLLLLASPFASRAQSRKTPIAVTHRDEDSIGQAVVFSLKEAIRASQAFVLVDDDKKKTRIAARIASAEAYPQKGVTSALGIVIVYDSLATPGDGILIVGLLHICGESKIDSCAKDILVQIDRALDQFRVNWPNLWKTL